jgi:hypothetical protein
LAIRALPNLLMHDSEMKADPRATVRRIAVFLDIPLDDVLANSYGASSVRFREEECANGRS